MESWRVIVLGDPAVGKTALIIQFTHNLFVDAYDPSLEDVYLKHLVVDNRMCRIEVFDTPGQEGHSTLRDQSVQEGQGFILVYSVGVRSTFERLNVFRHELLDVKHAKPVFMLVGNKCDLHAREVSKEEGEQLARSFGCDFIETSAKTALNVERLFASLVRQLRAQMGAGAGSAGAAAGMGAAGRGEAPGLKPGLHGERTGKRCVHM